MTATGHVLSKGLLAAAALAESGSEGRSPQRSGAYDADSLEVEYVELASRTVLTCSTSG